MSNLAVWGIHELQPVPDWWLLQLNPQVVVHAGAFTNEPEVNMQKHRARGDHLVHLLPESLIAMRWWFDDNILLRLAEEYFKNHPKSAFWYKNTDTTKAIAQMYMDRFARLHVPGTILMVGNEDSHDKKVPAVYEITCCLHTAAVRLATAAGIPLGVCCTPLGTPEYGQHKFLVPLFEAMKDGRDKGVVHWWRPNTYVPVPINAQAVYDLTNRNYREGKLVAKEAGVQFPPMFYGEIGTVESLDETGNGQIGAGVPVEDFVNAFKQSDLKVPAAIYCWGDGIAGDQWAPFNIARDQNYVDKLPLLIPRSLLTAYEQWQKDNDMPEYVNLGERILADPGKVFHFSSGENMQMRKVATNIYQFQKNGAYEEIVRRKINGVWWITRGIDTSQWPPASGDKVYALYEDDELTRYTAPWTPEVAEIRKIYKRVARVQWRNATSGDKIAQGSGFDTTYFMVVKDHKSWTTPDGKVTLSDVAECIYSHDPNMTPDTVRERYFYARGYSLVRYKDPNMDVFITDEPASLPAIHQLSWWVRPSINFGESPVIYPNPNTLGPIIKGTIVNAGWRFRSLPTTKEGVILDTTKGGEEVEYHELRTGLIDANEWYAVTKYKGQDTPGWVATGAGFAPVIKQEKIIFDHNLVFVTQLDSTSKLRNNDCGHAGSASAVKTRLRNKGYGEMPLITVDNLIQHTPLRDTDGAMSMDALDKLLTLLGLPHTYADNLTPERTWLVTQGGELVLLLMNYNGFDPSLRFGHYALVAGLAENNTFVMNDSYNKGERFQMAMERLRAAQKDLVNSKGSSFASKPYQGYIITLK